jgi:hypothetical protein
MRFPWAKVRSSNDEHLSPQLLTPDILKPSNWINDSAKT